MKKNFFTLFTYITLLLYLFSSPLYAGGKISAFLPEEVGKLKLGMTLDEYIKTFPGSQCVVGGSAMVLYLMT